MGMTHDLKSERLYIDANVFIFAAESHPTFAPAAQEILSKLGQGNMVGITSELTLAELLVVPLRQGNRQAIETYKGMLGQSSAIRMVPITRSILREAPVIRAKSGQKLPDAIHLATALNAKCTVIVSQDQTLRAPLTLRQMSLPDPTRPV
jgi:predicted nucleic acid-binding protein